MMNIYERLDPSIKVVLERDKVKYKTVKKLIVKLNNTFIWSDLQVTTVQQLLTFSDINILDLSGFSYLYGEDLLVLDYEGNKV